MSCNDILVTCPHCKEDVLIEQLNCLIFRHGVMKTTGEQIDPHASKETCNNLITNHLIYGCGKPFKVIVKREDSTTYIAEVCDYI
jgi:hypothetical protein